MDPCSAGCDIYTRTMGGKSGDNEDNGLGFGTPVAPSTTHRGLDRFVSRFIMILISDVTTCIAMIDGIIQALVHPFTAAEMRVPVVA